MRIGFKIARRKSSQVVLTKFDRHSPRAVWFFSCRSTVPQCFPRGMQVVRTALVTFARRRLMAVAQHTANELSGPPDPRRPHVGCVMYFYLGLDTQGVTPMPCVCHRSGVES
mmetsp:Transcript_43747/g.98316  ORF Transcript_43747/g.98316 Transcript_43747/m.98316 type:complete len:112 (-) Transcript_43747:8-343(-)